MPTIINTPERSRNDSRGMTEAQAQEYVDLMGQVEDGQSVLVDESTTDGYEKSYAKGERVRNAIKKFKLTERAVKVVAFQGEDEKFQSAVAFKDD